MQQSKAQNPWWTYLVYAGTDVLGKFVITRLITNGLNRKTANGVNIKTTENMKPVVDPDRVTATSIIGSEVRGSDGRTLGKIEEIAMDLTRGSISYVVLAIGGFLGIGDKFYAIPLPCLSFIPEQKVFLLDIKKNEIEKMPGFDKQNWPKHAQWQVTTKTTEIEA